MRNLGIAATAAACLAVTALSADAAVIHLSRTVGNGSFEEPIYNPGATNPVSQADVIEVGGNDIATGGDQHQLGASGGARYASTISNNINDGDQMIIPGWYFNKDSVFGGLNHNNSGRSDHGLVTAQTNRSGDMRGVTDTFTFDVSDGNVFRVQGAFAYQSSTVDAEGDYSLLLRFGPGEVDEEEVFIHNNTPFVLADRLPAGNGGGMEDPYNVQVDELVTYNGPHTTVRLEFVLDSPGNFNANSMADDFHLTQIPEPTSAMLLGLVGTLVCGGTLRRRVSNRHAG